MERAARLIGGSSPFKGHEVTDNVFDLSKIENPVYRFLRNHILLFVHFFVFNFLCLYLL